MELGTPMGRRTMLSGLVLWVKEEGGREGRREEGRK